MNNFKFRILCSILLLIFFTISGHAVESWKNESCFFYDIRIEKSPKALIEEFLHRDGEGEFLKPNPWLNIVFECPSDMSEPSNFEVIKSYKILQTKINHNKALVTVQYEIMGTLNSHGERGELGDFKENHLIGRTTFELQKKIYGWRIKKNNIIPRVLIKNVLRHFPSDKWLPGAEETFKRELKKIKLM